MSVQVPTFVVVGHVNKGKSSVVATLTEDPTVPIDWTPGTTATTGVYTLMVEGKPVLRLLDTPGFQDAPAALAWMQKRARNAAERRRAVTEFVTVHRDQARFTDEVDLLANLESGDVGILYVVDGSRPYRPSHEAEMEILRWTGQPGMALINRIGDGDHGEEWKPVLLQFFNVVRDFNAHEADFEQRTALLQSFAEVREEWKPALHQAVQTLTLERHRRDQSAAQILATSLQQILSYVEKMAIQALADEADIDAKLRRGYQEHLRRLEVQQRSQLNRLYGHVQLPDSGGEFELLNEDLFSQTSWKVFGLTPRQLTLYAAGWGALMGGGLDLMVGGLSFGTGALLGAVTGGVGAWLGSTRLSKAWDSSGALFQRMFPGETGRFRCFGPLSNPRFAWVLLDRGLMHWFALRNRAHARNVDDDSNAFALSNKQGVVANLPQATRDALDRCLRQVLQHAKSAKDWPPPQQNAFAGAIMKALHSSPTPTPTPK